MDAIRVILFDDNSLYRDSMSMLLNGVPNINFIGAFSNCNNLLKDLDRTKPDVVLLDIDMPGLNGIEACKVIRSHAADVKILMQTVFDDPDRIFKAICAGAHGYMLKGTLPAKIIEAIDEVNRGGAPMTPEVASKVLNLLSSKQAETNSSNQDYKLSAREKEVLKLLVEGKAYKMISAELNITYDTVRAHIKKIYEKLHVNSMTEAVAKAIRDDIV